MKGEDITKIARVDITKMSGEEIIKYNPLYLPYFEEYTPLNHQDLSNLNNQA